MFIEKKLAEIILKYNYEVWISINFDDPVLEVKKITNSQSDTNSQFFNE